MKTETNNPATNTVIWNNNEDLLTAENILPEIANVQITSILSNLDERKHENNYVILKEKISTDEHPKKTTTATNTNTTIAKTGSNFEDILYFVCNLCPFLCTKNAKIIEHLENAHKNKTVTKLAHLKCPACINVFFHKMSLRSHLIHDHGVGNSDINLIVQTVVYYATKRKNENNRKLKEPVTAPAPVVIPKELPTNNNDVKKEVKLFKPMFKAKKQFCKIANCKVSLQNADNLSYHQKCHKDENFICLVCNEIFINWRPLASHLWRLHKIDMELYACDKCSYKSVSLAKLNNIHKLTHSDVKAYTCNVCKKAFKNSKQLGNHKVTHKKDYERLKVNCELCAKNFADRRQLRIHMRVVHEKIKPFLCSFCGYKGSSRSSLKMHIRQHTGEKPFACDVCTYTTSDHNSLRRHKLRHTGQKPYKCSYCSYACIQSSTYKVHLKTKHPGQEKDLMFTCHECQFRSVNKEMYTAHMITVHNQKPQN